MLLTPTHRQSGARPAPDREREDRYCYAACIAELVFGTHKLSGDFQYFHVGDFLGGGLVLNGTIFNGSRSNAAAVGSMLVPYPSAARPQAAQLLAVASVITLHRELKCLKRDTRALWDPGSKWEGIEDVVPSWIENVSWNLAFASINAVAVTDVSRVVIDGWHALSARRAFHCMRASRTIKPYS
jgi:predicted NBD/HSP70 family sugar kinase